MNGQFDRLFADWSREDLAAVRRSKAALPEERYQAFVAAAQAKRAEVLAGLEVAGHSVSRHSREIAAAAIDKELQIVADLRRDYIQQTADFSGPKPGEQIFT